MTVLAAPLNINRPEEEDTVSQTSIFAHSWECPMIIIISCFINSFILSKYFNIQYISGKSVEHESLFPSSHKACLTRRSVYEF